MKKMLSVIVVMLVALFGCASMDKFLTIDENQKHATVGELKGVANGLNAVWSKQLQDTKKELLDEIKKLGPAKPAEAVPAAKTGVAGTGQSVKKEETLSTPKVVESVPTPAPRTEEAARPEAAIPKTENVATPPATEYAAKAELKEVRQIGDKLKTRVDGLTTRVVKISRTQGAHLELTGMTGEKYFLIGPFRPGSSDVKDVASQLKKLVTLMEKEGLAVEKSIGFADTTHFKSAKDAADNVAKNLTLAKSRAEAVTKALGKLGEGVENIARGTTEQFDGRAANRCVMMIGAKKTTPTIPAPTPPAPPPPSAPTPSPTTK